MVPPCTVPIKLKIIGLVDDIKGGAPLLRMFASFSFWVLLTNVGMDKG